ncbi:MAG: 5'/3'-nucleotidase SurE [Archangiaceae bacterium]|nr:5'/3'-nucleotidase SurE [Archangiaceae bacterium]
MRILVSNDDGIASKGLQALVEAVSPLAEVWVVAPETEQSAASHALSLHRPLRVREQRPRWFAVDGTPADCVYMAVHHLMKDELPRLVVSGINHGPNLADDVIYSGTVAAAMEAVLLGLPAVAFSLVSRRQFDFEHAARFAGALAQAALKNPLPPRTLLNVNVPSHGPPEGYQVTRLGRHHYKGEVAELTDPRGRSYYWLGGSGYEHESAPGTDVTAVHDHRRISITPLQLDLTEHQLLDTLRGWNLEGFSQVS